MRRWFMNIFVYSDESGVFDKEHNDTFVFGGLILLGACEKDQWSRRYIAAERVIRSRNKRLDGQELKATRLPNGDKGKLYRALNGCYKFGVVIEQKRVHDRIFQSKKDKQRYLDYAYKIAIKRAFEDMINRNMISAPQVERIYFVVDEHTTATNGCYELKEGLEQEFKIGTYNYNYGHFYPPIFPSIKQVELTFCNSSVTTLVRASDIIANRLYHKALNGRQVHSNEHLHIILSLIHI